MHIERLYSLDWLRVCAFMLLILFHVGLMYSHWGYVFKSPRLVPAVEWALIIFYPWRILLIFFISGVASRFLIEKLGPFAFTKDRLYRLVPVLVVGILIINPCQNYFEVLSQGSFSGSYFDFWANYYLVGDRTLGKIFPTWDHLWFLVYLLVYVVFAALIYGAARQSLEILHFSKRAVRALIFVLFPWIAISNIFVSEFQPATFDLVHDWAVHLRSLATFTIGFVCAKSSFFWWWVHQNRKHLAAGSVFLLIGLMLLRLSWTSQYFEAGQSVVTAAVSGIYAWSSILTIVAYSAKYLDGPSTTCSYLTVAILPVYVLHQPIMIAIGFFLFPLRIALYFEVALIVLGTTILSLLVYEVLIKRSKIMRFIFGLKVCDVYIH